MPEYSKRLKTHLILHLVDSIVSFGPTQCYNTERYVNILVAIFMSLFINLGLSLLILILELRISMGIGSLL